MASEADMVWRLIGLTALALLLLAAPFVVIPPMTLKITVAMPHGPGPTPRQVETAFELIVAGATLVYMVCVLGLAAWLARRIIRRHRARETLSTPPTLGLS
jgi:hypothetical protein